MNYRRYFFIIVLLSVAGLCVNVQPAHAVNCTVPLSGNLTISSACAFPFTIDGVDTATGANTAVITMATGGALTISAGQTVVAGSVVITAANTSVTIINTGSIKLNGSSLYVTDADNDGYPASTTFSTSGTKRRGALTGTNENTLTLDCKDTGAYAGNVMFSGLTCYYDADNDDYGINTARTCLNTQSCATATWGTTGSADDAANINFASNTSDCGDGSALAKPGGTWQAGAFSPVAGWSGNDWNCDGVVSWYYSSSWACAYCVNGSGYGSSYNYNTGFAANPGCGVAGTYYTVANGACANPAVGSCQGYYSTASVVQYCL